MRVSAIAICYASVQSKKGPACPAGLICYGGEQYKPEECGVDGDNNGWCKGASVPPELFMQPEPKKKPAPKASAQKKKKKKSSGNSGKIVARVQAGSKPKPSKLNITRPKKAEEPKPEPTPEPVKKSGGTWLYIFIRKYISLRKLPFCGKQTTTLLNEILLHFLCAFKVKNHVRSMT